MVDERLIKTESDRYAVERNYYVDVVAAERVRHFIEHFCRHSKGRDFAGKPFVLLDWEWEGIILPLFGWMRPDGTRRFRKGYIGVAKKNGKSALASALSLYLLMADGEPGSEVYNLANDRDQASIVFNESANMAESSPGLYRRLQVTRASKLIRYPHRKAFLKALSAEVPTKEGINAHGLIFDELHAQKTRELWDAVVYSGAARRQPLLLAITTAGYDKESICHEQYSKAKRVLDGREIDPSFFAFVAEAGEADDWSDPAVWRKANPSLGVTIDEETFRQEFEDARLSVVKENAFRRYRLNQWTAQEVKWIREEDWDANDLELNHEALLGATCFAGIDMSTTTDISAVVLVFPHEDGTVSVLPYFWTSKNAVDIREHENKHRLDAWIRAGLMIQHPGRAIDHEEVGKFVDGLGDRYHVQEIAIDRWNSHQLQMMLSKRGFNVVRFGQGFASMSAPTKRLEELVLERRVRHGGNPVLRWMVLNVQLQQNAAGDLKPAKDKSSEKIDGAVALIMGLGQILVSPGASIYEQRGLVVTT